MKRNHLQVARRGGLLASGLAIALMVVGCHTETSKAANPIPTSQMTNYQQMMKDGPSHKPTAAPGGTSAPMGAPMGGAGAPMGGTGAPMGAPPAGRPANM
jgi:hypothetical protein